MVGLVFIGVFLVCFVLFFVELIWVFLGFFTISIYGILFLNHHEQKEFHPEKSLGQGVLIINAVFPISL